MRHSLLALAGAAAVWMAVACLDVSSPVSGIASISRIISPSPSVVMGDSLRDTSGRAQPLHVLVFDSKGDTVTNAVVRYYVIDTTGKLSVDSVTGFVKGGDSASTIGAVYARVWPASGKGSIDTPFDTIPVVPAPDSAVRDTNFLFTFDPLASDTNSVSLISAPFGVTVYGAGGVVVPKYVVVFDTISTPKADSGSAGPTVALISAFSTNDSTIAITDASGHATLRLRIRKQTVHHLFNGATDSAQVQIRVLYQGKPVPVRPSPVITIRIQAKLS